MYTIILVEFYRNVELISFCHNGEFSHLQLNIRYEHTPNMYFNISFTQPVLFTEQNSTALILLFYMNKFLFYKTSTLIMSYLTKDTASIDIDNLLCVINYAIFIRAVRRIKDGSCYADSDDSINMHA